MKRYEHRVGVIHLEHARLEKRDHRLIASCADGDYELPAETLTAITLGPGTSITHAAVTHAAHNGTTLLWVGADLTRLHATGTPPTHTAHNAETQAELWVNHRNTIAQRIHTARTGTPADPDLTINQIRGHEGTATKQAYENAAAQHGVPWHTRQTNTPWENLDPPNLALSTIHTMLYAHCHTAIHLMGYIPNLGFVHHRRPLGLVYDLADIFKIRDVIPIAFHTAAQHPTGGRPLERAARHAFNEHTKRSHLPTRLANTLQTILAPIT